MPTAAAPVWVQSSTAAARPLPPAPPGGNIPAAIAPAQPNYQAIRAASELPAAGTASDEGPAGLSPALAEPVSALPPAAPLPTLRSPDGRFVLTDSQLLVENQSFGLRELERADVAHVRWVLWVLLGALGLAAVLIAFLQNWLRTTPAAASLVLTALLLAYGQRGTNRLRLWRLGPAATHFALPGELELWQRLVGELNRRIARAHDRAAAEAAALLAVPVAEPAQPQSAVSDTPLFLPDSPS